MQLQLRQQETPYGAETSHCRFQKPLVATTGALQAFEWGVIYDAYLELQRLAQVEKGLEYLQVFVADLRNRESSTLWFIEDDLVVTALLPSEY